MRRFFSRGGSIAALALILSLPASAQIISADFDESLNLPEFGGGQPRLLQNLNVALPSPGPHLTEAHEIANPSGWEDSLIVTFNATTNILSLVATGSNSYQTITVSLSDLQFATPGQQVIGIVPISTGNVAVPSSGPTPTIDALFTPNSVSVTYSVELGLNDFFQITTNPDTFQVLLSPAAGSSAPEPGTLALLGAGLGMVGLVARRKR